MRKTLLGLAAAVLVAAPLALVTSPADAASGDQLITNGDFSSSGADGSLIGATTAFALTTSLAQANNNPGSGSMWDPGTYVVGSNPNAFHALWADFGNTDPQMIVNGFQNTNQKVWSQTVAAPVCDTPNSKVTYDFTANATNILPAGVANDGGANIEVKINGTSIGSQDLTGVNAGQVVQFVGAVPAAASMEVTIWNNGTAYSGNDFAIDDISLIQRGDCEPPCQVTHDGVWFNYTGKYTGTGAPALNDPKWHALPAQPGGQHDVTVRGFNKPYQPGADKGKGDWFVWKDLGNTCP
jgi:hypothetical protein